MLHYSIHSFITETSLSSSCLWSHSSSSLPLACTVRRSPTLTSELGPFRLGSQSLTSSIRFVPQANRALRPLNIYLNTRTRSRLSYLNIFRLTTSTPSPVTQTSTNPRSSSHTRANQAGSSHNGVPTFTNAPLRRTSSSSSHSSQSSIGSLRSAGAIRSQPPSRSPSPPASPVTRAPSSPTPANHIARGVPIPPIPPAQNPRGEIIFSSRVSGQFREGYERYRSEWERRRSEAASAAKARRGWWPIRWWKRRSPPILVTNDKAALDSGPLGSEKRGRRTSNAGGGSKNSSRQASPVRSAFPGSAAVMSTSSTTSTPTSSRAPSPEPDDSPAYGTKDGSRSSGRIRAASFSALLESMDEGEDGLGAMDEVHLVPSGVNG